MFSVYGMSGRLFHGSLEQLRHIGPVSGVARTHAVRAVGREGRAAASGSPAGWPQTVPGDEAHRIALAAYAQTAQEGVLPRHPLSRVDALMSRSVITVPDTMTVLAAWQMLASHGVGQAPVVNGAATLVGLLSRADLLRPDRLPTPDSSAVVWRALLAQSVADLMWTPVPGVAPDTDIRRVARVLLDTGLPGLPVVDGLGLVIGFVSRSDILRAVVTEPPLDLWG
jgi:CBS domain-containing protein